MQPIKTYKNDLRLLWKILYGDILNDPKLI